MPDTEEQDDWSWRQSGEVRSPVSTAKKKQGRVEGATKPSFPSGGCESEHWECAWQGAAFFTGKGGQSHFIESRSAPFDRTVENWYKPGWEKLSHWLKLKLETGQASPGHVWVSPSRDVSGLPYLWTWPSKPADDFSAGLWLGPSMRGISNTYCDAQAVSINANSEQEAGFGF